MGDTTHTLPTIASGKTTAKARFGKKGAGKDSISLVSGGVIWCLVGRQPAMWRGPMRALFVQIKCDLGKAYQVADEIAEAEIASEIYSTAGDFDLLVKFYLPEDADIGHFITEKVQPIGGIRDTRTIPTFKAFQ